MNAIESIIDIDKQNIFKINGNKKIVFHPSKEQTEYLLNCQGWKLSSVNCTLDKYNRFVDMKILCIGYLIFYRPVKEYHNAEFENFFDFGCKCDGFSINKIRFSYGYV